jgi:nucleoside transporter
MMFVNYIVWGAWYVTISTYLTQTLHFTGLQTGAVFGTVSVACLVSPFFVGLVADRFFATEKVMAVLYALGAVIMYFMTKVTSFSEVYALMILFCLCYFPNVALTNSITMQQVADPGRDFPPIRVMGTLGFIFIGLVVGSMGVEATTTPFLLTAAASALMCLISLTMLPHTPPKAKSQKVSVREILGLDTLSMMKDTSFLVFVLASILACIPLTFYYSFTNAYLNEIGVLNAAGKMTLGQVTETGMMLAMPFIFRMVSVRGVLIIGLAAWAIRYFLLANGDPGAGMWMFYIAIALHGICYDFFFVTGQLYTDQKAPAHLRSSAQGFLSFATYGVGMLIGSLLSGGFVDYFSTGEGTLRKTDWHNFWMSSAGMSAFILLLILLFFRTGEKIQPKKA